MFEWMSPHVRLAPLPLSTSSLVKEGENACARQPLSLPALEPLASTANPASVRRVSPPFAPNTPTSRVAATALAPSSPIAPMAQNWRRVAASVCPSLIAAALGEAVSLLTAVPVSKFRLPVAVESAQFPISSPTVSSARKNVVVFMVSE